MLMLSVFLCNFMRRIQWWKNFEAVTLGSRGMEGSKNRFFQVGLNLCISSRKWSWWKNFCSRTFGSRDIEVTSSHTFTCILYRSLWNRSMMTKCCYICNLMRRIWWWKNFESSMFSSRAIWGRSRVKKIDFSIFSDSYVRVALLLLWSVINH